MKNKQLEAEISKKDILLKESLSKKSKITPAPFLGHFDHNDDESDTSRDIEPHDHY